MNYIHNLQAQNSALREQLAEKNEKINDFISFLHSDKFKGVESDGSRKDWISTADVLNFLMQIRD